MFCTGKYLKKFCVLVCAYLYYSIMTEYAFGSQKFLGEESQLIRSVARVAANVVYDHTLTTPFKDIWCCVDPIDEKTMRVNARELDSRFHAADYSILKTYGSVFDYGSIKGCIYSVDKSGLENKIFIAFCGSRTTLDWAKNITGLITNRHNLQESVDVDVDHLLSSNRQRSLKWVLKQHVTRLRSVFYLDDKQGLDYYFIGHSRGGASAICAAHRFKDYTQLHQLSMLGPVHGIHAITYCAPKLANVSNGVFNERDIEYVNFICPSDFVVHLPWNWAKNPGVEIKFKNFPIWNPLFAHKIPSEKETDDAVVLYNQAAVGLGGHNVFTSPLYFLKPALFGAGVCCMYIVYKEKLVPKLITEFAAWFLKD